jgi:hypothetical protein
MGMPVDYRQIQNQVKDLGKQAVVLTRNLKEKRAAAWQLLQSKSTDLDALREKVKQALSRQPGLRCAIPTNEPLTTTHPNLEINKPLTLLAADGSQINPSHHDAIEFAVINLSAICFSPNQPPVETVQSHLIAGEGLFSGNGVLNEEMVALLRDVQERQLLLRLAANQPAPVLALTDGPIEIYGEPKTDPDFERQFSDYLSALRQLAEFKVNIVGYVDKPGADLVIRLLELAISKDNGADQPEKIRPFIGVTDISLFAELLPPGSRSAVFGLQSRSSAKFTDALALHFFYLNTGREGHPSLARVEIPAWVAAQPDQVDLVHAALLQQCQVMGSRPYPYALHRAHEIAVIRKDEKESIASMIANEYYRQGIQPGQSSGKQSAKDLSGKARYER